MKRPLPLTRRALIAGAAACASVPGLRARAQSAPPASPAIAWGINLAGAEFGDLLGQHGREYLYPEASMLAAWRARGFSLVRLPFKWERLQPKLDGDLDAREFALLDGAVSAGIGHGLTMLLDPHNYAKRRIAEDGWQREHEIGSTTVPATAFTRFWAQLAERYASEPRVHFGLMNEPASIAAEHWRSIAQATLSSIRKTGARNQVYVPGTAYTGAHSWMAAGNSILGTLHDPAGALTIEVHQYLDGDSSGTKPSAVSASIGSERLWTFQNWARQRGLRAFLGEFGAAQDERSLRALIDMLDEVAAHPEIWTGVAAWAGGPRWPPDEMFNLEPHPDGREKKQAAVLRAFATDAKPAPTFSGHRPDLYIDQRRGDLTHAGSSLDKLLRGDAATLWIEAPAHLFAQDGAVLPGAAGRLLYVDRGRLASELCEAIAQPPRQTVSPGQSTPPRRIRYAMTFDKQTRQVATCITGGMPQTGPLRTGEAPTAVTATEPARVTRLAVVPFALPTSALAELVA